jgi:hypothetical protein
MVQQRNIHRGCSFPQLPGKLNIRCAGRWVSQEAQVVVREMNRTTGGAGYFIDQLENPILVVFAPGGLFGKKVLLSGSIDSVSQGKEAQSLKGKFEYRMKKHFSKRGADYVGSEAEQLRQQGFRLTGAVQSPPKLDLS